MILPAFCHNVVVNTHNYSELVILYIIHDTPNFGN